MHPPSPHTHTHTGGGGPSAQERAQQQNACSMHGQLHPGFPDRPHPPRPPHPPTHPPGLPHTLPPTPTHPPTWSAPWASSSLQAVIQMDGSVGMALRALLRTCPGRGRDTRTSAHGHGTSAGRAERAAGAGRGSRGQGRGGRACRREAAVAARRARVRPPPLRALTATTAEWTWPTHQCTSACAPPLFPCRHTLRAFSYVSSRASASHSSTACTEEGRGRARRGGGGAGGTRGGGPLSAQVVWGFQGLGRATRDKPGRARSSLAQQQEQQLEPELGAPPSPPQQYHYPAAAAATRHTMGGTPVRTCGQHSTALLSSTRASSSLASSTAAFHSRTLVGMRSSACGR